METRRRRVQRWLSERGLRQWWKAGVAVMLAVAALFGGLDKVNSSVTTFRPGQQFSDGEFTVTVERAKVLRELSAGKSVIAAAAPGRRYLGVVVALRNDGTVPSTLAGELDLRHQPNKRLVGVLRVDDGSRIVTLGPGLSEHVVFAWELPENDLAPGDLVSIRLWRKDFREGFVTYGERWIDSISDYGEVTVPVGWSA